MVEGSCVVPCTKQTQLFYILNDDNSSALICKMFYLKNTCQEKKVYKKTTDTAKQASTLPVCNEMVDLGG